MAQTPIRHSKETPKRHRCSPKRSRSFKIAKNLWEAMHPLEKMTPEQRGALAYLGEPMSREERK